MFLSIVLFWFLAVFSMSSFSKAMIPSIEDYFPDLKGNLVRVEWFHAVNNQHLLKEALSADQIHMLEADIVLGTLVDETELKPIMAHPPHHVSDLSLEQFVQAVIDIQPTKKRGIKLDFKSDEAYNASWPILDRLSEKLTFPVWLNADIFPGPGNSPAKPLNPKNFVQLAVEHLPDAPLSLGWTTAFQEELSYTDEMLNAMKDLVQQESVQQPITLAVRAAFAALSENGLLSLVQSIDKIQNSKKTTLTIWMSSASDLVDIPRLRSLMTDIGEERVALDVPSEIRDQLLENNAGTYLFTSLLTVGLVSSFFLYNGLF